VKDLERRIERLEEKAATRNRPTGSLVLIEGQHGNAEEIRQRARDEIRQHGRGPLVILFADDKPEDPPLPSGVIRFDKEDAALL
jgi:hypothetical protein